MKDAAKTKAQLMSELEELRQRIAESEILDTELKQAEEQLRRRDAILEALATSTKLVLEATSLDEGIQNMLEQLGQATEVSRVYVFENHLSNDGTLLTSQRHEWVAPGITPQIDNPDTQNFPWVAGGMGRWVEILNRGETVQGYVKDFPQSECEILSPQGIKSIVVVPIFIGKDWWGFVGFDQCLAEREWSAAETEALKAWAGTLGAFIQRKRVEEALRRAHDELQARVEERTTELLEANEQLKHEIEERKQVEEALRSAHGRLRATFDAIQENMNIVDLDFYLTDVNEVLIKAFGLSDRESVLGRKCFEVLKGQKDICSNCAVAEVYRTKAPVYRTSTSEDEVSTAGKSFEIFAYPIMDEHGNLSGAVQFARNITERKLAEEALRKAHEELERRVEKRTAELAKANEELQVEITERKQAEEALRKAYEELEMRVDERTFDLVKANEQMQLEIVERTRVEEALRKRTHDIDERVKELNCLFGISKIIERQDLSWEEVLQGIVNLIPPAYQYSEITCARVKIEGREFKTHNYQETIWKQTRNIVLHGKRVGTVEVCYLEERPESDEGPFLKEERRLINVIAERLGKMIERRRTEEHIRQLSQQLMQAQEIARQRLAFDLHDHLAQDLSTLKISLDTLFDDQPDTPDEKRQRVSELSKKLQRSITTVREMVYNLHPPGLDELGLVQTVRQYCEEFAATNTLEIDFFSVGMDAVKLDFDTEITLYRLIQEGLKNISKHADASRVTIKLSASFSHIMLHIEDNGKGFDIEKRLVAALEERRMGLRSMEQRVAFLNGEMKIESRPMQGTKIRVKVPYMEKANG